MPAAAPHLNSLLPDQPAPVDEKQRALTDEFLWPLQAEIFDLLVDIRRCLDPALSRKFPSTMGKPYPLGRCLEITNAVRHELLGRLSNPSIRAEAALRLFLDRGGILRPIWGALRGLYFQNATQFGGLYVDVSNDTVNIEKPKIEIRPIDDCDFVPIRDIQHFRDIAVQYWGIEIYANTVVPSLAPLFPMIGVHPSGKAGLLVANDYMIALARQGQFRDAEQWLAGAPIPPDPVFHQIGRAIKDQIQTNENNNTEKSVYMCIKYRRELIYLNNDFINSMINEYLSTNRIMQHMHYNPRQTGE